MSIVDRVARVLVVRAARRWPDDLAEPMAMEWQAELAVLRAEPGVPAVRRAARTLGFAASIAVSPAVEPEGAEPVSRAEAWGRSLAGSAAVALLAGGLFNAVHAIQHRAGAGWADVALVAAAAVMAGVARWSRTPIMLRTAVIGAVLFAFLLAGNRIAVMPFMGWVDILPAVLAWTGMTTLTAYGVSRLAGAGRRRLAALVAVGGGFATLDLATIAGGVHAAASLAVGLGSAPAWFPLTLLPGGTVTFGPALPGDLPAVAASQLLLGNASAMAGPMLLCSVFVLAAALRRSGSPARARSAGRALEHARAWLGRAWLGRAGLGRAGLGRAGSGGAGSGGAGLGIVAGAGAAAAALVVAEVIRRAPAGGLDDAAHRLLDNSTVFGFGFLAHTPGRVLVALIAGIVAGQLGNARRHAP